MPEYTTPGVIIEEKTGPGVIAGVGTSTAAFIGPAPAGPLFEANRISSYEDYLRLYATTDSDGNPQPHIVSSQRFYLPFAVRGFYDNGGRQAFVVRVGTAKAALWTVLDQGGQPIFRVRARQEGTAANGWTVALNEAHRATGLKVAIGKSKVDAIAPGDLVLTLADVTPFKPGDVVTEDGTATAKVKSVDAAAKKLTLEAKITGLEKDDFLRLADFTKDQKTVRLTSTTGLFPGSVVKIKEGADEDWAVVESVDKAGFVTFASSPARAHDFKTDTTAPELESFEFDLVVTPQGGGAKTYPGLSLQPQHPAYVLFAVASDLIEILPPLVPPISSGFPDVLPDTAAAPAQTAGANDEPENVTADDYQRALDELRNVDEVNILCAPDAAAHADWKSIQQAMIQHCVDLEDRFAVLDAHSKATPATILTQRQQVESPSGRAALYFPWLEVRDPLDKTHKPPNTMFIPPSGHIAGIYARTDQERGVHKAPANTDVRGGVVGIQYLLNDDQQGPLNKEGINVLRIFQGSATVVVWGARTTVRTDITDWTYVNVRRLMLFIEESIQEGIRWAVFEPNNLTLWQQLKRTINDFLTRVWRDGALFGDTAEKAFRVRIDEALNPPSTRALGQLFIEISVAPVRPAEFIIVRIGQWDGGGEVKEG
jgi:phage tail sheath protein FI